MPTFKIREASDSRVDRFRNLNRSTSERTDTFVAESKLAVARAIDSHFRLASILTDERYVNELPESTRATLPVYVASNDLLGEIVGFEFHRGQLASVYRQPMPDLAAIVGDEPRSIVVVCPEIADPTNLAGIIRNASALGASGLLLGSVGADPFSRRVVRVSVGNVFRLPIRKSENLREELQMLRHHYNFQVVATVVDDDAERLPTFGREPKTAILFGGEGYGLAQEWIDSSDRQVTLPMHRKTDSLNVATATGIFLYHFSVADDCLPKATK